MAHTGLVEEGAGRRERPHDDSQRGPRKSALTEATRCAWAGGGKGQVTKVHARLEGACRA